MDGKGEQVAIGVANLIMVLDPQRVILGGGVLGRNLPVQQGGRESVRDEMVLVEIPAGAAVTEADEHAVDERVVQRQWTRATPLAPASERGLRLAGHVDDRRQPVLRAAEPWEGPAFTAAPEAVARAATAIPTGAEGVTVLLSETLYVYDAAGRETYTQRLVYKIGSASVHESWSAVEEAWSPWRQETPRLQARVITPDGGSGDCASPTSANF